MMYIYLDQNKWIDFGRAILGKPEGAQFKDVSEKIITKVESGEWTLPISIVHLMETLDNGDQDRKKRFSEILVRYSKANTMCTYQKIEKHEYANALLQIIGKQYSVDEFLFKKSIYNLIDLSIDEITVNAKDEKIKEAVQQLLVSHEGSSDYLLQIINMQPYSDLRDQGKMEWMQAAIESEEMRKKLFSTIKDDTQRYRHLVAGEYEVKRVIYQDFIWQKVKQSGASPADIDKIIEYIPNNFDAFLESIPSLYIRGRLMFQRFKDASKPIHRNDIKDTAFLCTAIPYCDIVITENSWVDYIRREGLDTKYSTRVFTNLNDLLSV